MSHDTTATSGARPPPQHPRGTRRLAPPGRVTYRGVLLAISSWGARDQSRPLTSAAAHGIWKLIGRYAHIHVLLRSLGAYFFLDYFSDRRTLRYKVSPLFGRVHLLPPARLVLAGATHFRHRDGKEREVRWALRCLPWRKGVLAPQKDVVQNSGLRTRKKAPIPINSGA